MRRLRGGFDVFGACLRAGPTEGDKEAEGEKGAHVEIENENWLASAAATRDLKLEYCTSKGNRNGYN